MRTIPMALALVFALPALAGDDWDDHDDRADRDDRYDDDRYDDDRYDDDDDVRRRDLGAVQGTGRLPSAYGSPQLHVNARGLGHDADGSFSITYPDNGRISGDVECLDIRGDTAWIVGEIEHERGSVANFDDDEHVIIGIRDRGTQDLVNFSEGLNDEPSCGPNAMADPTIPLTAGNFDVRGGRAPRLTQR